MRKILFVSPSNRDDPLDSVKALALPPLGLALLAGCTPERFEIKIVDEALGPLDLDREARGVDLAAITCVTPVAPRAYEIGARLRRRGIPVVLGGVHPSMMPHEAADHADAVVVGEGEEIWPTVLRDAEAGRLRPVYTAPRPELERLPRPRRDLLPDGYFVQTVQTSRGCPFNCHFCSVTRFSGGRYRFRPIEDVVDEVARLPGNRFFFIDDNIVGAGSRCRRRAAALFDRMRGLGKQWGSQTCIDIVEDDALLRKAAQSGAKVFFIGFESIETPTLVALNKRVNLRTGARLGEAVKRIHDHGIAVVGGFIFGNDRDPPEIFERTVEFIDHHELDGAQFTIQTPLPGTALYEQMAREGRLVFTDYPRDWRRYNVFEVVYRPRGITAEALKAGQIRAYRETASLGRSIIRAAKTLHRTQNLLGTAVAFWWSYGCYTSVAPPEWVALARRLAPPDGLLRRALRGAH